MEAKVIKIGESSYPCRVTMGALRRFKQLTGKEVTEVSMDSAVSMAELIYCCVASACNADRIAFNLTIDDFCDSISPDTLADLAAIFMDESGEQKKSL